MFLSRRTWLLELKRGVCVLGHAAGMCWTVNSFFNIKITVAVGQRHCRRPPKNYQKFIRQNYCTTMDKERQWVWSWCQHPSGVYTRLIMSGYQARCRDIREGLLRYFIDCDTRPGQDREARCCNVWHSEGDVSAAEAALHSINTWSS